MSAKMIIWPVRINISEKPAIIRDVSIYVCLFNSKLLLCRLEARWERAVYQILGLFDVHSLRDWVCVILISTLTNHAHERGHVLAWLSIYYVLCSLISPKWINSQQLLLLT
jgi:hypothetical protein